MCIGLLQQFIGNRENSNDKTLQLQPRNQAYQAWGLVKFRFPSYQM